MNENLSTVIPLGYAQDATGGALGDVYRVTNLKGSGLGSLPNILANAPRPCTIAFDVAGVIELEEELLITGSDLTINGSDAQGGPGIVIKNYPVTIQDAQNIILTQLGIRRGMDANEPNSFFETRGNLRVDSSDLVVLDHLSLGWDADENAEFYAYDVLKEVTNVSMQHCLCAEGLYLPRKLEGSPPHSAGVIIDGSVGNITIYGNLFASSSDRHPNTGSQLMDESDTRNSNYQIINNYFYHVGYAARFGWTSAALRTVKADVIGNYHPTSHPFGRYGHERLVTYRNGNVQALTLHMKDNLTLYRPTNDLPEVDVFANGDGGTPGQAGIDELAGGGLLTISPTPVTDLTNIPIQSALEAGVSVLENAGKRLPGIDPIDARILHNVKYNVAPEDGGQRRVNDPEDVGGYQASNWVSQ